MAKYLSLLATLASSGPINSHARVAAVLIAALTSFSTTAQAQDVELAIFGARVSSAPATPGQSVPVVFVVRNSDATRFSPPVRIIEAANLRNTSETRQVPPGETAEFHLNIEMTRRAIQEAFTPDAHFSDWVFLQQPTGGFSGSFYRDANMANNRFQYTIPAAPWKNVQVTLERIDVHDDCDNVSDGEWYIGFVAANFPPAVSRPRQGTVSPVDMFPGTRRPATVKTNRSLSIDRTVRLSLAQTETLHVGISAVDCDSDSPVGIAFLSPLPPWWPIEIETRGLGGLGLRAVDCSGHESIFELSGNNDFVGTVSFQLPPGRWLPGGDFMSRVPPSPDHDCGVWAEIGATYAGAYTAHIRVEATP